jgi:hypothetical protein
MPSVDECEEEPRKRRNRLAQDTYRKVSFGLFFNRKVIFWRFFETFLLVKNNILKKLKFQRGREARDENVALRDRLRQCTEENVGLRAKNQRLVQELREAVSVSSHHHHCYCGAPSPMNSVYWNTEYGEL